MATDLIRRVVFCFFWPFYPLCLAISRTEIFAFVDSFRLLSDRQGNFARSAHSHI